MENEGEKSESAIIVVAPTLSHPVDQRSFRIFLRSFDKYKNHGTQNIVECLSEGVKASYGLTNPSRRELEASYSPPINRSRVASFFVKRP